MPNRSTTPADEIAQRLTRLGERLVDQPVAQATLSRLSTWSARLARGQEATLEALNLPSAVSIARLDRRLRGVSDRIGRLEDELDRLASRLQRPDANGDAAALSELSTEIRALRARLSDAEENVVAKP